MPLPEGAAEGICPRCLVESALNATLTAKVCIGKEQPGAARQISGRYHTIGVLGEGGMGIVYLAEQREPSAAAWP